MTQSLVKRCMNTIYILLVGRKMDLSGAPGFMRLASAYNAVCSFSFSKYRAKSLIDLLELFSDATGTPCFLLFKFTFADF